MDVTQKLLDALHGPGPHIARARRAAPAKKLTEPLREELARLCYPGTDRTMGFVSNVLAYSGFFRHNKKRHTNILRLIKGGFVRVVQVSGAPPPNSIALRDSPFGDRYYVLEPNCASLQRNPQTLKWTQRVGQDPTTGQVQVTIRGRYPDTTFPDYEFIVTSAGDDNWKLEQKTPKFQMIGFFSTPEEAQERARTLMSKKNPRKKTSKKRANLRKKATNVRSLVSKALR